MSPEFRMLLERLLWPVPRVRWESARGLAHLIREEDREAAPGLLNWISARRLESEAVIGLGIIDAFDLGSYFEFINLSAAIRAPSHLSDYLLKKNFPNGKDLSPFRYSVSSSEPVNLPPDQKAWFGRYRKSAVAPIFSRKLSLLQEHTGLPVTTRWEHDWGWLQATEPRPEPNFPYFFCSGDRKRGGQFDLGQRELYVTAYLRTLAYFSISGSIEHRVAETFALLALTMNRGLADLEPVARPAWAQNLLPFDPRHAKEISQHLWANAKVASNPNELPLALRVVDFDANSFLEFDMTLAIGRPGFTTGPPETEMLDFLFVNGPPGEMGGKVEYEREMNFLTSKHPYPLSQVILPEDLGRIHTGMAFSIRLASPCVFRMSANVQCGHSEVRLETEGDVVSRWIHWYADWQPTMFPELDSVLGSITTISKSRLDRLRDLHGLDVAPLVKIRWGTRKRNYHDQEVQSESFWHDKTCEESSTLE